MDVEGDHLSHTGLEVPSCLLFSVTLKETFIWQKVLSKLEMFLSESFNFIT